ncbi:hypothetical protein [Achromobacter marplatensis]|uniref:hypothetical protein n=1 Tax=Achromobacter marplatensis TaxID=470868 RepID=UPI003D026A7C
MEITEAMIEAGWGACLDFSEEDMDFLPSLRREMVKAIFQAMLRASQRGQEEHPQ